MTENVFITTNVRKAQPVAVNWTRAFWQMFAWVFVLRVAFVLTFPCDLSGDEAYYWEWGRHLAWGYFSKPPFIAWIMALAGWTGGNTAIGLRLWAALLGSGSMLVTFFLARRVYCAKTGFWSAALIAAMPGAVLLNLVLTIDAPLVFFWVAALFCFHVLIKDGDTRKRVAAAIGLFLVLGLGHLSKQIMWLFPPLAFLYLVFDGPDGRAKLRSPLLWFVMVASYLFLVPTILWNAHHGWITFLHTGHHFKGDGFLSFPKNFGGFLGMQFGALSPLTAILVLGLSVAGLFSWRKMASRERFLVTFSGLPVAVVLLLTLRQTINGNWPAAFYPAGAILVAGWAFSDSGNGIRFPLGLRKWLKPALWVSVGCTALILLLTFSFSAFGLQGLKIDPYARIRGWKAFAAQVDTFRKSAPRTDAPIIVVGHRYYASELAFYLPGQPRVYHWTAPGAIDSQYEIWGGLNKLSGQDVLIISTNKDGEIPTDLRACLAGSSPRGEAVYEIGHGRKLKGTVYWSSFIGLPKSADNGNDGEDNDE